MKKEMAVFGAGCFWGAEHLIREVNGVLETEVGYVGGSTPSPTYADVKTGATGHAEAVSVVFDSDVLSFEALLGYFFMLHDPTQLNRQQNDIGTQYRSVIFCQNDQQTQTALAVKARVQTSGKWKNPVVTEIAPSAPFTRAEDYHQDYLIKNPDGYTCHFWRK